VDDIAQAHMLAMDKAAPGSTYIVAGEPATLEAAMELASRITGIGKPMVVPPAMLKLTAFFSSLVEGWLPLPDMYRSEALRVQAGVTYLGNNAKAKKHLGYQPRPLSVGLRETLDYERQQLERK
jgi:dihydroflavonol-4-reductase